MLKAWDFTKNKPYQNITSRLMFITVFGILFNFFIVLPILLKTCRTDGLLLLQDKMCAPEKSSASQSFCALMASDRHRARNLSRPDV